MPPVRRGHKNSYLWSYFSVTDNLHQKAKCDLCGQLMSFRGTITNLKTHLKRKHPTTNSSIGLGYITQVSGNNTDNNKSTRGVIDPRLNVYNNTKI